MITGAASSRAKERATAVLAMGLGLIAALSFACGLVLDSVSRGRKEVKRLAYLSIPAPPHLP